MDAKSEEKKTSISTLVIGLLLGVVTFFITTIGAIYIIWSLILIFSQLPQINAISFILNILSLLVEGVGISYTIYLFAQMTDSCFVNKQLWDAKIPENLLPEVSILIPIHQPNIEVLKETLEATCKINYPKERYVVIVGDDSPYKRPKVKEEIKTLAEKLNIRYYYNPSNIHFKAGMLNLLLKQIKSKYVVLLDYDHIISPDFVIKSVNILESNDKLGFVQAKVNFRRIKNKMQMWESVMYAQFFEVFQRAKNIRKIVITNGSTLCVRRDAIEKIGGVPIDSFTEDVNLSIDLLTSGYRSYLLDEYGSFGLVPDDFRVILSQLLRWSRGSLISLKRRFKKILTSKIKLIDKIDLLFNVSVFLISASMYLVLLIYLIMFLINSEIIRISFVVFPPLLLLPIALSISYQLSGLLAVYFARKDGLKFMSYLDLISFYLIALVLNPFTIYALLTTLFYRRIPSREKDEWNPNVPIFKLSGLVSIIGCGLFSISIIDFFRGGTFWIIIGLLSLSMIATLPLCVFFSFKTKNTKHESLKVEDNKAIQLG